MNIINIATFSQRKDQIKATAQSLSHQADLINIVFNDYLKVPDWILEFPNIQGLLPERNIKDEGKFMVETQADDMVMLCDDDIIYPPDYVSTMISEWQKYASAEAIVGVHGIIYPDFFDGRPESRQVFEFRFKLGSPRTVSQLGTGTVVCKGYQMPDYEWMEGAAGYVDVRFARHALSKGYPLICIEREDQWLQQQDTQENLYQSANGKWEKDVIKEIMEIAGFLRMKPIGRIVGSSDCIL